MQRWVWIVFIAVWAGFGSAALSQRVERPESFNGDSNCQTTQGKHDLSGKFNPTWSCHFEGKVIPGQYQQEAQTQQPPSQPQSFLSRAGVAIGDWLGRMINDPIAAFTLALVIVSYFQWKALQRQAKVAERALTDLERAFVFVKSLAGIRIYESNTWQFKITWENSGSTPTKNMKSRVQCEMFDAELPSGFDFDASPTKFYHSFIGPHATIDSGTVPEKAITDAELILVRDKRKFLYIWGISVYSDVFPKSTEHTTRFCYKIDISGDIERVGKIVREDKTPIKAVEAHFSLHPTGNCADDECKAHGL